MAKWVTWTGNKTQILLSIFSRCLGCELMAVAAGFRIIKEWGSTLSSHLEN